MEFQNRYRLKNRPAWRAFPGEQPHAEMAPCWSDATFTTPPAVGSRVMARGGFGPSTVTGYFIEHGFLGVHVRPDNRPEWHVKQSPRRTTVSLFGIEIQPLTNT